MIKSIAMYCAILILFTLFSASFSQEPIIVKPTIQPHGVFLPEVQKKYGDEASCDNGRFWSRADAEVADGGLYYRKLDFYDGTKVIYSLTDMPGTSISISNAGYMICGQEIRNENGSFDLTFYSTDGKVLFTKRVEYTGLFGFSPTGTKFLVGDAKKCEVISLPSGSTEVYPFTMDFDVSADESVIALGNDKVINICSGGKIINTITHGLPFFRNVRLSPDGKHVGFIGKNEMMVYGTQSAVQELSDRIEGEDNGYMDLRLSNSTLWAGIHVRNAEHTRSEGLLRTFDLNKRGLVSEEIGAVKTFDKPKLNYNYRNNGPYPETPWPLEKQDEPHKLWNSYLQLANSADGTSGQYLHQGTDFDVPTGIQTRSVADGYVKANLTKGGDIYWRVAISEVQVATKSDAWLHAHLIQSSIAVKVGDKVKLGDPIGQVIAWSGLSGGHLHYSRIRGTGTTWTDWASWGNVYNPMFSIRPIGDVDAPKIETADATNSSKFAYGTNDASTVTYMKPDALKGDVDIIVKVSDKAGASQWSQAATIIYYTIKEINGKDIVPRKLALVRNQTMPDYDGPLYYSVVNVMYRVDSKFLAYGWFTTSRHYGHNITNSKGDTTLVVADKSNTLKTKDFPDGAYRVIVEVYDGAMNKTIDSQDVKFANGNPSYINQQEPVKQFGLNYAFATGQKSVYRINYQVPVVASNLTLRIMDMQGKEIKTLVSGMCSYGRHFVDWDGTTNAGVSVPAGMYLYSLKANNFSAVRKFAKCR